jgi:hypothetical protein
MNAVEVMNKYVIFEFEDSQIMDAEFSQVPDAILNIVDNTIYGITQIPQIKRKPECKIHILEGNVETVYKNIPEKIAISILDMLDMFKSEIEEMESLRYKVGEKK